MLRIKNAKICLKNSVQTGLDVLLKEEGRIRLEKSAGLRSVSPEKKETVLDAKGLYLLPGFIEIHTHGAALFEFTMGRYNLKTRRFEQGAEVFEEELPRYAFNRASTGTTNLYPGTWAASLAQIRFVYRQLKNYMESSRNGKDGSFIPGGVLEGAFLNPEMCGAQNPKFVLPQKIKFFDEMNESGVIRFANAVPDYGADSIRLIKALTKRGINVGAGHTRASAEQIKNGADAGLKYAIHFLNGPTGSSHKPFGGGGALEGFLKEDRIYTEIISDGIHVSPEYVRAIIDRKGVEKVMAVSDAMFASQARGVKEFEISGIKGKLSPDARYVFVKDKKPLTLFSSVLTMDRAFSNLLSFLTREFEGVWTKKHPAWPFERALLAAVRFCATNICEMMKLHDCPDSGTGEIRDGKWADLILGEISGKPGNYNLKIRKVFVRGREVFSAGKK